MKYLVVALGVLAFASPVRAQPVQVNGCKIVRAGLYATDEGSSASRDSNGVLIHSGMSTARLALSTTTIPAKAGVKFGFEYMLTGSPDAAKVTVRDELHYPAPGGMPPGASQPLLVAPSGDDASINRSFYSGYTLEEPWELLPGKWEFQIWLGNRELCSQEFKLTAE